MKNRYLDIITSLFIVTSLISCTNLNMDEVEDNIQYETSLALPIGTIHANIADMLNVVDSNYIATDTANNIYLLWSEKDLSLNFQPEQDFATGEKIKGKLSLKTLKPFKDIFPLFPGDSVSLSEGEYPFFKDEEYIFGYNEHVDGEKEIYVDSIVISKALIDLEVFVEGIDLTDSCYLTLDFNYPEIVATETNDTLDCFHLDITSNHSHYNNEIHHVKTFFKNNDEHNATKMVLNFKLVNYGKTMTLSKDAKIKFNTQIKFINFDEIYGLMWQKKPFVSTEVIEDIPTEFFNTDLIKNNKLLFSNPEVEFVIKNNIGIPIRCEVSDVYAVDENGEKQYADFSGSKALKSGIKIPKHPYDTTHTIIVLNRENGGTNKLFKFTPKTFSYTWKIYSEGASSDGKRNHFLVNPLDIKVDINARMPFQLDAGAYFCYKDTIAADMSSLIPSNSSTNGDSINVDIDIKKLNLHLDATNSLPTTIDVNLIYLDEFDQAIRQDTLNIKLQSAQVNEDGIVTEPTKQTFKFENTNEDISQFLETKKIAIEASAKGFDENSKIYLQTTNAIDIKLGVFINAKASTNDNNK